MAKTKFLSRVLAVLMALSMLCSTGVFADYNSGLLAGEAAVTGEIAMTSTRLNGGIAFWTADNVEEAKWFDVADGLTLKLQGTTSAQTGTITYAIAPVDTFAEDPFDPVLMENTAVAIGAEEFTGGAFNLTIEANAAKLVKDTTYELRLAYSKTDIVDVTDASSVVYQRYFRSFDWADAGKASRVINKPGIGDITIDIETNPYRNAVAATKITNVAQKANFIASPTHIRTANLTDGDVFNYSTGNMIPADFKWAGEDVKAVTTSISRQSMLVEIGDKLRGGVVLGMPTAEVYTLFKGDQLQNGDKVETVGWQQQGNVPYRFKATAAGTVYILGSGTVSNPGWTNVEAKGGISGYYNGGSRNYLYVASEITDEMLTAAGAADVTAYLAANKTHAVQTLDAAGYYLGSSKAWQSIGKDFYKAGENGFIAADGSFQIPSNNLDANGNWKMTYSNKPYSMGCVTNYGYTEGRGWLTQAREFDTTYSRTFEAGEWVEIPYDGGRGGSAKNAAVIQFDVPAPAIESVTYTPTLDNKLAFEGAGLTKSRVSYGAQTVTFDAAAGTSDYVVKVPYGTASIALEGISNGLVTGQAETINFNGSDVVEKAYAIGAHTYNLTFKWDDSAPYVYDVTFNHAYAGRSFVQRAAADGSYSLGYTSKVGANLAATTASVTAAGTLADAGKANTHLTVNGAAIPNNEYFTLFAIAQEDNFAREDMLVYNQPKWVHMTENPAWTSFKVSADATVYVKMSHANAGEADFVWKEGEAAGWTKAESSNQGTIYYKRFTAGATVNVPSQVVTQAELDFVNAKLATAYPETGSLQFKYQLATNAAQLYYSQDGKAYDDASKVWTAHPTGKNDASNGAKLALNGVYYKGLYYRNTTAHKLSIGRYGSDTFMAVAFDQPATIGDLSYTIGAGEAQAIELDGTKATVEVPFATVDTITLAATMSGTGSVEVSEPIALSSENPSATMTATLKDASGAVVETYEVTFVWGAPEAAKLSWTSALALTKAAKTQDSTASNRNLYAKGIYGLGEVSGELELDPANTAVELVVPYGVEAVKINGGEKIDLLSDEDHTVTTTVSVNFVEYTVTIKWAAYAYAAGMPMLYDLEYHYTDKTSNVAEDWYYAVPSNLVLNADMDLVYGEGTLIGTDGNGKVTVTREDGEWFTATSQVKGNYGTVNNGANINRHRISPYSFESFVANGDIDDKYAFDGATILVTHYKDDSAVSPRYTFKSAVDGYVIVAGYQAQDLGEGWTRLEGSYIQTTTASTGAQNDALKNPPEGHTNVAKAFGEKGAKYSYIYAKAVDANEVVEIAHTAASGENPPLVMVVTEDMLNERVAAPTLLASLSYTTELANDGTLLSGTANARTGGFYQPTLVTDAATVAVAADATTVNVTVPYGTEIVKLAGVDTYAGAVEFDAINLINNNGRATLTKTVGEVEYTINVAWDAFGAADAEKNLVYDVAYGVKELVTGSVYNTIPTKLDLAETRIYPDTKDGYVKDAAEPKLLAGKWSPEIQTSATNSTVKTAGGNNIVTRGRLAVGSFAPWVEAGIITANGVVGTPLVKGEEETDAEFDARVDAIAYAAMNGAGLFVADYNAYTAVPTADYAYKFKVAQDSIIYVQTNSTNIGEGWTKFGTDTYLAMYGGSNDIYYYLGEDGTYTKAGKEGSFGYTNQGAKVFYRYASAGEEVSLKPASANRNIAPLVFVRPLDFSAIPAPTLASASYKIGDGEATAIEFDDEKKASVVVPWGTNADISVAAVVEGLGGATVSGPINLATADGNTADITVTVTPTLGGEAVTYTVTFAWGAAPVVEAVTYSTAATIYKVATVTDVEVAQETQDITVPWGTASVTVSYKIENADAVALKAVSLLNGAATVEVPLPTGAITLNFAWGNAPAGQYIIGLTKTANNWRDRMFVSFGDLDNAHVAGNSGYAPTGSAFFADGDVYSFRVPEGLAKRGEVAVIADAGANYGLSHMQHSSFPYLYNATYSVGTEAANSWLTFTVAKDGMLYFAPASFDGAWEAGEALGWTVAPFGMEWAAKYRKLYQKKVSAGEVVYFPNDVVDQAEIDAKNATLNGYNYVQVTQEDIDAMSAAVKAENAEYFVGGVIVGDYIAKYDDDFLAAGEGVGANYAGFRITEIKGKEVQFNHYGRADTYVLFAVADANVAEELKAPKYTGATIVPADESIELSASKAIYAEDAGEITFELKETAYATLEGNVLTANRDAWVEGAAVEVIVKQTIGETVLESTAVITIGAVDTAKYGYLTIAEPEGNGVIEGYLGEELVLDGAVEAMEFAAGETVKLVATPVGDYEFKYWALVDANGKETIYSEKNEVIVTVPNSLTLKPVFAAVVEGAYNVTFKGYQGAIIASYNTASVDAIVTPEAFSVFGYDFVEYKASGWADTYGEGDTIAKELIDKDLVFVAQYEQKPEMVYTVTVIGGTVNGAESAEFKYNKQVKVVAGAAEEGMKFSHWVDEAGQILSYDAEFKFYMAAADRTVTAVYVEEDATVSQAPVITMTVTTIDEAAANGPIYGLYAERRVPEEYTVVQNGIIWGVAEDATDAENITHANKGVTNHPKGDSKSKFQNNNGQYTVQLQMTEDRQSKGDKWYARTFLTFVDANGTPTTIYSNPALIWEKQ